MSDFVINGKHYDTNGKDYQDARKRSIANHKASGNASFPAMRTAELEAGAKSGNLYDQRQLQLQGHADIAIISDEARAGERDAHNWGVAADVTQKLGDTLTGGAQRDLMKGAEAFQSGDYRGAANSMLHAGGKVALTAIKGKVADKAVGALIGKGASLMQSSANKFPVRAAGEFVGTYGQKLKGYQDAYQDYFDPARKAALDFTH